MKPKSQNQKEIECFFDTLVGYIHSDVLCHAPNHIHSFYGWADKLTKKLNISKSVSKSVIEIAKKDNRSIYYFHKEITRPNGMLMRMIFANSAMALDCLDAETRLNFLRYCRALFYVSFDVVTDVDENEPNAVNQVYVTDVPRLYDIIEELDSPKETKKFSSPMKKFNQHGYGCLDSFYFQNNLSIGHKFDPLNVLMKELYAEVLHHFVFDDKCYLPTELQTHLSSAMYGKLQMLVFCIIAVFYAGDLYRTLMDQPAYTKAESNAGKDFQFLRDLAKSCDNNNMENSL
jgi:hypothetical protein